MWGICAEMILLARQIEGAIQTHLGLMDIAVELNAFGRQLESFEVDLTIPVLDGIDSGGEKGKGFRAVFICGPSIRMVGEGMEALTALDEGVIVASWIVFPAWHWAALCAMEVWISTLGVAGETAAVFGDLFLEQP